MSDAPRAWGGPLFAPTAFLARQVASPTPRRAFVVAAAALAAVAVASAVASHAALAASLGPAAAVLGPGVTVPYLAAAGGAAALAVARRYRFDPRVAAIVGWSWAPAGFVALLATPVAAVRPGEALVAAVAIVPPWQTYLLGAGLRLGRAEGVRSAVALHAALAYAPALGVLTWALVRLGG
ncbi:MAG: hypothetical protein RI554_10160 [Trueperaceae bacterium]|nr:hypothetical protein [Trueperaceae bacterium]